MDERIMRARRFVAQAATRTPFADDYRDQSFSSNVVASIDVTSELSVPNDRTVTSEPFTMEEMSKVHSLPSIKRKPARGYRSACQRP